MTAEKINSKIELTEAAIELYLENGNFSMKQLGQKTGKTASQIYALFPNKKSILSYYYPSLVIRYHAMIEEIDDFDSYTISEKLSNFIFTLFDIMGEHREFVEETFNQMVFGRKKNSLFYSETTRTFKSFLTSDGNIAVSAGFLMKDYFYEFIAKEYLYIIKYWLDDNSENYERTFALTDKLTGFLEELVYNKTIDKGFDLAKYLITYAGLAKKIPLFGDMITNWFKGKENND